MEYFEEGKMIHFDLVNLGAHIREHVVLTGKFQFQILILFKQIINNLRSLISLLLHYEVIFHEALVGIGAADFYLLGDRIGIVSV